LKIAAAFPVFCFCLIFLLCGVSVPALAEPIPVDLATALVAGNGDPGYRDGAFYQACFSGPGGLALDKAHGAMYVADTGNHAVRKIDLRNNNFVSTLCGGRWGDQDGIGSAARLSGPTQVALWPEGGALLFIDQAGGALRKVDLSTGATAVLRPVLPATAQAPFYTRLIRDSDGFFYVLDTANRELRRVDPATGAQSHAWTHPFFAQSVELSVSGGRLWAYDPSGKVLVLDLPVPLTAPAAVSATAGIPAQVLAQEANALTRSALPGGVGLISCAAVFDHPVLLTYLPGKQRFESILPEEGNKTIDLTDMDGGTFDPDSSAVMVTPTVHIYQPFSPPVNFALDPDTARIYASVSNANQVSAANLQRLDWDYNINETKLLPKPAGSQRLLFLGSSVLTWDGAFNIERQHWWPKRFEQFMALKRAMRGCGTPLEVEVLQLSGNTGFTGSAIGSVPRWAPVAAKSEVDELVLAVNELDLAQEALGAFRNASHDDVADPVFDPEWVTEQESENKFKDLGPLSRKLYDIYKASPGRFHGALMQGPHGVEDNPDYDNDGDVGALDDPEIRAIGLQIIRKAMVIAAQAAKQNGIRLKIVLFPVRQDLTDAEFRTDLPTTAETMGEPLGQYCSELGIGFVNMIPTLRMLEPTIFPLFATVHLLERGHFWFGWTLAELWDDGCGQP
jgi:DNA-binding beta-propeller fold protein YncE